MVEKRVKVSQSVFYFLIFIVIGIMSSINGPMLPLLSKNTHVTVGNLGMLFTAGSIGFVITSLLNGHFFDRLPGHKVMFFWICGDDYLYGFDSGDTCVFDFVGDLFGEWDFD